jgi:hypothetical protein
MMRYWGRGRRWRRTLWAGSICHCWTETLRLIPPMHEGCHKCGGLQRQKPPHIITVWMLLSHPAYIPPRPLHLQPLTASAGALGCK